MTPLYNASIHTYRALVSVVGRFNTKARKLDMGQREVSARLAALPSPETPTVWIHAASLGEFEQGRPLIERIKSLNPEWRVVLSFFSPSGYEVRKDYELADFVTYLPFDTPGRVKEFLDAVRPDVAIFVKYEFWGNYLAELYRREIPTYIISAIFRPGQSFFRPWGGEFRKMLRRFTTLMVQDEASRRLLSGIGVENVLVTGDTRFDRVADVRSRRCAIEGLEAFTAGSPMTFIAGSSWPEDERVYLPWLNAHPEVKAIIAPHEFDSGRLALLKEQLSARRPMLLSEWQKSDSRDGADTLIVDSFGHLSSLYRYADVAYIGGGFGAGIHNINEAAVYGIPVVFGPRHSKFIEARGLIECGGGVGITDRNTLEHVLSHFLNNPSSRSEAGKAADTFISSHLGATDRVYEAIFANFPPK